MAAPFLISDIRSKDQRQSILASGFNRVRKIKWAWMDGPKCKDIFKAARTNKKPETMHKKSYKNCAQKYTD